MSFGDVLREVSEEPIIEKLVWEKMKPELIRIAGDRHAKGCHVRFIGFGKTFKENIKNIMVNDGILNYSYNDEVEWHYGTIDWGNSQYARIKCNLSDMYLIVTLSEDGGISVERAKLAEEQKKSGCEYIA